jgi:hypothetical protein
MSLIKYYKYGYSTKICLFSYASYQAELSKFFCEVDCPNDADFILFSYINDIRKDFSGFLSVKQNKPVILVSEEPVWDNSWSTFTRSDKGDYIARDKDDDSLYFHYHVINHKFTDIFEYKYIPYFLTTDQVYLKNYQFYLNLLNRIDFNKIYKSKTYDITGLYYRKTPPEQNQFDFSKNPTGLCLNGLKDELADYLVTIPELNCDFFGRGNKELGSLTEETIYTGNSFHRNKLDWCFKNAKFLFALENTIENNYLTEKIFDSVLSLSIPIFYDSNNHHDFIGINIAEAEPINQSEVNQFCLDSVNSLDVLNILNYNYSIASKLFANWPDKLDFEIKLRVKKLHQTISNFLI